MNEEINSEDIEIEQQEPQDLSSSVTTLDEPVAMTIVCALNNHQKSKFNV